MRRASTGRESGPHGARSYTRQECFERLVTGRSPITSFYPIPFFHYIRETNGDIAQLARAAALQAVGRGFESLYLHEAARAHRVDRS